MMHTPLVISRRVVAVCIAWAAWFAPSCRVERTLVSDPRQLPAETPARFHLRDGSVIDVRRWEYIRNETAVRCEGVAYDLQRRPYRRGALEVELRDISVAEFERQTVSGPLVAMAVLTSVSVVASAACLSTPKACFGSCPTFYVRGRDRDWALQAEGFSTSIARSLEADDLDDLPDARADADGSLSLLVRNEALETHAIRSLSMLVVDAPAGAEVIQRTPSDVPWLRTLVGPPREFWAARSLRGPTAIDAQLQPAPTAAQLAQRDRVEWTPGSDGVDLASKTSLHLRFDGIDSRAGVVAITARNSLLSTYVFYHMLALRGRTMGEWLARIERREPRALREVLEFDRLLGGIDVEVRRGDGAFEPVGSLAFIGPITAQTRGLALEVEPGRPIELRLTFARAHWRIDAVRVGARSEEPLSARELRASAVVDPGRFDPSAVRAAIAGEGARWVTLPGDAAELRFDVGPERPERTRAFFIASRGYYYEWSRDAWRRDEDPAQAEALSRDPRAALRVLAPAYRAGEAEFERVFEQSRVGGRR